MKRLLSETGIIRSLLHPPEQLRRFPEDLLSRLRILRQHKMIHQQGTDLKYQRITGIILPYILPTVFQRLLKRKRGKLFREPAVCLSDLPLIHLGFIPHQLVNAHVKIGGKPGKQQDIRVCALRLPFRDRGFGHTHELRQFILGDPLSAAVLAQNASKMDFFHPIHLFQEKCCTFYGIVRYRHADYNGAVLNFAEKKSTFRKLLVL